MKEEIERSLAVLIGRPMWAAWRAADMEMFHFGDRRTVQNRNREAVEVGDYALHVQCAWRLVDANRIVVASRDYYYPAGDPDVEFPNFDHDQPGTNRRDERMDKFFSKCGNAYPIVYRVEGDRVGSLRIVMSGEVVLELFPDDSLEDEYWRFFQPRSDEKHFIVTGQRLRFD